MRSKFLAWFFLAPLCCWADVAHLTQQLVAMENESPDSRSTTAADLFKEILQTGSSLNSEDWRILLAEAMKSVRSVNPNAQSAGFLVLYLGSQTGRGDELLDPYIEDLAGFVNGPDVSIRQSILAMLAAEQPRISSKAAAVLVANLDEPPSPPANAGNTVYRLLAHFSSDPAMIHKLVNFAEKSSEPSVSSNALEGLKFVKTLDSQALAFATVCLRSSDRSIKAGAIDLIEAKHLKVRAEFSQFLGRIAANAEEPQDLRLRARHALAQKF